MSKVFRNKKCTVEIDNPKHGDSGFRITEGNTVEEVFYDKGGRERLSIEQGSSLTQSAPGWVTFSEQQRRKKARSRYWKKTIGQKWYWDHLKSGSANDGRYSSLYGEEHPHACG